MLTQDLISDTSGFRLLLRVSASGAHAVVFAPDADGSLISSPLPYDASANDPVKGLEDAIYDNPLLLGDFRATTIVVEPKIVSPMPAEVCEPTRYEILERLADLKGCDIIEDPTGLSESVYTAAVAHDVLTFLRRTFPTAVITTHLGSLTRFFASRPGHANAARMLAAFRHDAVDLIAIQANRLLMANTFRFTDPADAVYYILASRSTLGLTSDSDELLLTGYRPHRDAAAPELRRFIARVMPLIFPPELFKAGKDSLLAPFDLMVSPLTL